MVPPLRHGRRSATAAGPGPSPSTLGRPSSARMVSITAVPAGPAASAGPLWLSSTTQSIAAVIASILIVLGLGLLALP